MKYWLILILLMSMVVGCIPNPLMNDDFDNDDRSLDNYKHLNGSLYTKDLKVNPGIPYWMVSAKDVIEVSIDGLEIEEGSGYVLEKDSVLIFEVRGVEKVNYRIIVVY